MANVKLDGVSRRFGASVAVDNLSLDVRDGEFVVFLGPSGCGKTTSLNMIAGLDTPTSGSISIGGREVSHVPPDKRDIAMVFQSIALYPHMNVYNNIAFPLRRTGVLRAEIDSRVRRVADMLKVAPFLDRKPHQLSGGQRQRVAIGRAAVREPAVFLFDEPLSSLDAKLRTEMRVELKKLHERLDATFVYVTHDQVEAMTMADRIAVMHDGHLMQFAPPREIYRYPANRWVAAFVGSPAMNIVDSCVDGEEAKGVLRMKSGVAMELPDLLANALPTKSRAASIGFRPEAVVPADTPNCVRVEGRVFAVEPVGPDTFVDIDLGPPSQEAEIVKIRLEADHEVAVDQHFVFGVPFEKLFLFDGDGRRVHPSGSSN